MCGRYASSRPKDELAGLFDVPPAGVTDRTLPPDWNVAPTRDVYVVLTRRPRPGGAARGQGGTAGGAAATGSAAQPLRRLTVCRWGLVPSWAKDPSSGSRMINARAETLADKPAFRRAFATRRCLVPADGFFEWYAPPAGAGDGAGRKARRKQPFFLHDRDGQVLAMAGLYEYWRAADADPDDPDAWLATCTVVTTAATDEVGQIHDRMPMVIPPDRWKAWLDPDLRDPAAVSRLLVPAVDRVAAYPVTTLVNDVRHNGPQLVAPIPAEGDPNGVTRAGAAGDPAGPAADWGGVPAGQGGLW